MTSDLLRDALVLTGPTASGKSQLGVEVAERLGAEIISMDSMTLYRGMDIGTAKPGANERRRVPHHLLDVLDPWESATVAWWLGQAAACCRDIACRGKRALFVGGTPLYLKALLYGLFEGPGGDEAIRARLTAEADKLGTHALHARLAVIDPPAASRLHPNDLRRVVRALEVWELTGRPISQWQRQWADQTAATSSRVLWLDLPRSELYERINARVRRMVADGLVEEVRRLRRLERPLSPQASQALGYKEMLAHLDGKASLQATIERIQTRSRNFAKRQLTWFRQMPEIRPSTRELTFTLWGLTIS